MSTNDRYPNSNFAWHHAKELHERWEHHWTTHFFDVMDHDNVSRTMIDKDQCSGSMNHPNEDFVVNRCCVYETWAMASHMFEKAKLRVSSCSNCRCEEQEIDKERERKNMRFCCSDQNGIINHWHLLGVYVSNSLLVKEEVRERWRQKNISPWRISSFLANLMDEVCFNLMRKCLNDWYLLCHVQHVANNNFFFFPSFSIFYFISFFHRSTTMPTASITQILWADGDEELCVNEECELTHSLSLQQYTVILRRRGKEIEVQYGQREWENKRQWRARMRKKCENID